MSIDYNRRGSVKAEYLDPPEQFIRHAACFYPLNQPLLIYPIVCPLDVEANEAKNLSASLSGIDLFLQEKQRLLDGPPFTGSEVVRGEEAVGLDHI